MDLARRLLVSGEPRAAFERLKAILATERDKWRVHELIGAAFHDLADAEGAAQAYLNAACEDKYLRLQREHFSNYLFALHYLPPLDAPKLKKELTTYNSLYRNAETLPPPEKSAGRISVAYIAPNFCDSSSARFYETLLTAYERKKFKITAWSMSSDEDSFTKRIKSGVEGYFDISETSFEEAAKKIRDYGADILVDLGGHTEGGVTLQIASYKPAQVQICGIGYFDSTGADFMDYFIGDDFLAVDEEIFSEQILKLRKGFAFLPNRQMISARKARRPFPHKRFTFGSLNNFMKLSDEYLIAVKGILEELGDVRIIFRDTTPLKSRQIELIERLNALGMKNFEVRRGENDYFTDYSEIDLILDTFPYPGGMMTALALYMGVPVLNLCGKMPHTRTGADILRIAGVDELVVYDVDTYIKKAVGLAKNRMEMAILTEKISIEKLTDTKSFVEDFYGKLEEINWAY